MKKEAGKVIRGCCVMSKENFMKFVCDTCSKSIEVEAGTGFPYKCGWKYLYNFSFKFDESIYQGIGKDKHFCSVSCFVEFIMDMIDKVHGEMITNG